MPLWGLKGEWVGWGGVDQQGDGRKIPLSCPLSPSYDRGLASCSPCRGLARVMGVP